MADATQRISLRPADGAIGYVETLLERNGLPTADVRSKPGCFRIASAEGDRIGTGGLEPHGTDGLLRSLVVERSHRGAGYGTAIRSSLESEARSAGIDTLYLLTTTASESFAAAGYARLDRAEVPAPIRETTEFADLCPTSATCLRKQL